MSNPANDNVIQADFKKKAQAIINLKANWKLLYIDNEVAFIRLETEVAGDAVTKFLTFLLSDLETPPANPKPAA